MQKKNHKENLDSVEQKRRILDSSVGSVCSGYSPCLFIWGPPGHGKTYHLTACLKQHLLQSQWKWHHGHTTPKGLFLSLATDPDAVHVFDDCETLLKTELSAGILRAACGMGDNGDRIVTYESRNEKYRVTVSGAVVILSNADLSRSSGPMQAVASRFRPIKWELSRDELVATIMLMAGKGWNQQGRTATAAEALNVAKWLIEATADKSCQCPLDLRLYTEHAMPAYLWCRDHAPDRDWHDSVRSKIEGTAKTENEGQSERTHRLEQIALLINEDAEKTHDEKITDWKERTGLGHAIYYRHLRNAKKKAGK